MKKFASFIRNCVELYIPMIAFIVLFLVFCFQVFMRYVIKNPQPWTLEVEQMCFLWLVLLGACYAQREKSHVTFTLLYDSLNTKGKAITAMLGNLIIAITFAFSLFPSYSYIMGLQKRAQVTSILKISKTIVFFPYVIFVFIILIYSIIEIYEDIMVIKGDPKYTKKLIDSTKSEAAQAIESATAGEEGKS